MRKEGEPGNDASLYHDLQVFVYKCTHVHTRTRYIASFVLKVNLPSSSGNSLQTSKVTPEPENLGMQKLHQRSLSEDS